MRFTLVGGAATLIHAFGAYGVASTMTASAPVANVAGFLLAFVFASLAHFYFTFQRTTGLFPASTRYFVVVVGALLLSTLVASGLGRVLENEFLLFLVSALSAAGASFLGSRLWAFA